MAVGLQLAENSHLHIDFISVFESHPHSQPRVLRMEVLVTMEGNITQPSDLLVSGPAEYRKVLVSHMHIYLERLLNMALATRQLTDPSLVMQINH